MPVDADLTWDQESMGCLISFEGNDIKTTRSLLPAVLISLFTDARAADDDPLPDPQLTDRRGWWGDAMNTAMPSDSVGSKLWLLEREKSRDDVVVRAKLYVEEALQWMIDEGVAITVAVTVEKQSVAGSGTLILAYQVEIKKPAGGTETFKFEQEWRATTNGSN